ncbi:hypothetical protein PV08_03147 [Exophiala spinifera]|uniref:C2H2-type domain-containing protein n=1 Tax=Exophiala spinifera TaxID=91928 RepID=A0A0D2BIV2_9EURO|nr:uncharacterized protein PV08_03147 [Exophiala spinifera]KIW18858.1 hypothetical protein PV08_03147 [Exophiala spinifera]
MFKSPSGVLIHLESRTCPSGTTPAQIDEWAFELPLSEDYTNDRYSRNKYRCSVCDSNFPKLSALFQHVESPACSANFSYYSNMEDLRAHIENEVEDMVDGSMDGSMDDSSDGYPW